MTGVLATVGAGLWLTALAGVALAAAAYCVVPWERLVDDDATPDAVSTVRLTRIGVTVGCLSLVPTAVGGWLGLVGTLRPWEVAGTDPTLLQRVAVLVPGDLVALGSLAGGVVAVFAPVWVPVGLRVRDGVG